VTGYRIQFSKPGTAGGGDYVVGHGADGVADEGEQDWGEDVVPAGAGHFALAEDYVCQQELERDPGDVKDGWGDAGLHLLDYDVAEAYVAELAGEGFDLAQGVDRPAIAKGAADALLRAAEFAGAEEAVGYDDAAAGTQDAMGLAKERGLVGGAGITTAFYGVDGVEGC